MPLTEKQRRFVAEYLVDLNGKAAAIRAGYARRSAKKSAWNNLARPAIAAAVAEGRTRRLTGLAMHAEAVLAELSAIARANVLDHLRPEADGGPTATIAGGAAAGLCTVSVAHFSEGSGAARREGRRVRIRMHDKIAALDRLAKHFGLYRPPAITAEPEPEPPEDLRETVRAVRAFLGIADATADCDAVRPGSIRPTGHPSGEVTEWVGGSSPPMTARGNGRLTKRQELFVAEYLVDLNGRQAAIRAGYSARWAKEIAHQTLARPPVAAAIAAARSERRAARRSEAAEVLGILSAIGRANLLDYMRIGAEGVPVVDLGGLDRVLAEALSEVILEEIEGVVRRIRIRMHDKIAALDRLARHHGLYREARGQEAVEDEAAGPLYPDRQVARAVLVLMREAEAPEPLTPPV